MGASSRRRGMKRRSLFSGSRNRNVPAFRLRTEATAGQANCAQSSSQTRSPSARNRSATARTTTLSFELWLRKTSYWNWSLIASPLNPQFEEDATQPARARARHNEQAGHDGWTGGKRAAKLFGASSYTGRDACATGSLILWQSGGAGLCACPNPLAQVRAGLATPVGAGTPVPPVVYETGCRQPQTFRSYNSLPRRKASSSSLNSSTRSSLHATPNTINATVIETATSR